MMSMWIRISLIALTSIFSLQSISHLPPLQHLWKASQRFLAPNSRYHPVVTSRLRVRSRTGKSSLDIDPRAIRVISSHQQPCPHLVIPRCWFLRYDLHNLIVFRRLDVTQEYPPFRTLAIQWLSTSNFELINQSFKRDQLYVQDVPNLVSGVEKQKTPMGAVVWVFSVPIDCNR